MSLFSKLFGKKNTITDEGQYKHIIDLVSGNLETLLSISNLSLSFDIEIDGDECVVVEFFGEDENMLIFKEGQLLDALQLYIKRVLQHKLPKEKVLLVMDCDGFREKVDESLISLADKLREMAINKSKPVYCRALSPRDRKVVHQHLADDSRVQSRSIGDGLYKKIKIYPSNKNYSREEVRV